MIPLHGRTIGCLRIPLYNLTVQILRWSGLTTIKKKAEIFTGRQYLQRVLETLGIGKQKKIRWKSPENPIARSRESCEIDLAVPRNNVNIKSLAEGSKGDQETLGDGTALIFEFPLYVP